MCGTIVWSQSDLGQPHSDPLVELIMNGKKEVRDLLQGQEVLDSLVKLCQFAN